MTSVAQTEPQRVLEFRRQVAHQVSQAMSGQGGPLPLLRVVATFIMTDENSGRLEELLFDWWDWRLVYTIGAKECHRIGAEECRLAGLTREKAAEQLEEVRIQICSFFGLPRGSTWTDTIEVVPVALRQLARLSSRLPVH